MSGHDRATEVGGRDGQRSGPVKRIVCAVDFSRSSQVALDYAMSLAQENEAALAVVHVIETHPMDVDFTPPAAIDLHAWIEQATSRLHQMVPDRVRSACSVDELVHEGTPSREILTLTQEVDADLIMLGVRGRRAADVLFFGSTTHHVIREAHCAVLTLRG